VKKRVASSATALAQKSSAPLAWSYSRLSIYRECAKKFYYKFIEKLEEPQSPAMARGQEMHELFEHYSRGGAVEFQEAIHTACLPWLEPVRAFKPIIEEGFAFRRDWTPTEYFARDVACRVKMDLFYVLEDAPKKSEHKYVGPFPQAIVIDYKTGKIKPEEHEEQLKLYARAAYAQRQGIKSVHTGVWYVDHEKTPRFMALFKDRTKDVPQLTRYWDGQTKKMLADRTFKATPSSRCSWCPFSYKKGGPCKQAAA
jgi:CRISPR/Cas system-associated exonuclease Cas4 (RecB family)